jgi:nitrogen fixation NifU-like protein
MKIFESNIFIYEYDTNLNLFINNEVSYLQYTQTTIDHFTNPRNVGKIADADGVGIVGNKKCGDIMKLYLKISNRSGKLFITDAKFKTFGCGAAVATCSILTTMIINKTIEEVLKITNQNVINALGGLPSVKIHCSCLAKEVLHAAIYDYARKNNLTIENLNPPKDSCACSND